MKIRTSSQFEHSECKYMIVWFLNSIPDLGKWSLSIQTLCDWHENLTSTLIWPLLNINLTLNLKNFQGIFFHLHENYKQDIEDKCDPNIGK